MVLIGLGSNLGASSGIIEKAFSALESLADGTMLTSGLWRTSPVDCPPESNDFVNAAATFPCALEPLELLRKLKHLERQFGRGVPVARNAPRELDLDLLLYGDTQFEVSELTLPHPRAIQRRFVLAPAAQIVPELVWPGTGRSVQQLLDALESDEVVHLIQDAGA